VWLSITFVHVPPLKSFLFTAEPRSARAARALGAA
jgi:hypothetical protein